MNENPHIIMLFIGRFPRNNQKVKSGEVCERRELLQVKGVVLSPGQGFDISSTVVGSPPAQPNS